MALDLAAFNVSPISGFLPEKAPVPLTEGCFTAWESLLAKLPDLIQNKTLRNEVDSLPELDINSTLKSEEQWQRAYVVLSFVGMGYVWMNGQAGLVDKVPKKLAVPWLAVSEKVGLKPVGTYASTVLYNFKLCDPGGKIDLQNIHSLHTFTGTEDESWFFMVHVCVELAAGPGLEAMARVYQHMDKGDHTSICRCLETICSSIHNMDEATVRMYDSCDPVVFYVKMRPFFAGFKNLDAFPEGIIYEGVDAKPREFHGASAGQSSSLYAFDMFLGTKHSGKKQLEFVMAMREYMPRGHREFLTKLGEMPSVREFCKNSGNPELVSCYNRAVDSLVTFRNNHIILVTRYIVNQKQHSVNPTLDARGTGGTEFDFLKRVRDDTEALKIKLS